MSLSYNASDRIFTLSTERSTYQMKVDQYGYLLHLYYGARAEGDMSYLLTYCDRSGMCGCPHGQPFGNFTLNADLLENEGSSDPPKDTDQNYHDGCQGRNSSRLSRNIQGDGSGT